MDLTFNTAPRPPLRVNPQVLTVIGVPKVRKTLTCSKIPDSYMLVLDPGGADFISAACFDFDLEYQKLFPDPSKWTAQEKLAFFEKELVPNLKKKRPAKRLVLDHLGILCDWILEDLNKRKKTLLIKGGKDQSGYEMDSVTEQRYGAGESMIDLRLRSIWPHLLQCAEEIVLICHEAKSFDPADPKGENKQIHSDIDLPGKVKKTPCELGSAVCKLSQERNGLVDRLWGSFYGGKETAGGTRILRLDKRKILLSECKFTGEEKVIGGVKQMVPKIDPVTKEPVVESFTAFWDLVYLPDPPKAKAVVIDGVAVTAAGTGIAAAVPAKLAVAAAPVPSIL
jgi:hypothetical protein